MAIWHYDLELIPRQSIPANAGALYELEESDPADFWHGVESKDDFSKIFHGVLPRIPAWCDELSAWGWKDGNEIEVGTKNGQVTDIRVRLDLR